MVSGRGAKAKGDNFEREIAAYLNDRVEGLDAYRTPLSGMRGGRETATPDISNTPLIAIECKRTETISARKWMRQAVEAAGATIINTGIGWHEARIPTITYHRAG